MLATLTISRTFRRIRTAAFLGAVVFGAACGDDDPTEPEAEPQVQRLRLTVGGASVTIDKTTGTASGNLVVPNGTSTIAAQWLRADGSEESAVTDAEFDLRIVPANTAAVTWTATGSRSGTLVVVNLAAGATTAAQVSLFHKEEQHNDFGPYPITIQRQ